MRAAARPAPRVARPVTLSGSRQDGGTAPGILKTPDGFDLLKPDGTTPTHLYTG